MLTPHITRQGGALAGGAYDQGGQATYYVPAAQNYGQDFSQDTYNQPPQQNYQGINNASLTDSQSNILFEV